MGNHPTPLHSGASPFSLGNANPPPLSPLSPSSLSSPSPSSPSFSHSGRHPRRDSATSIGRQLRRASRTFEESHPPEGFMSATGDIASSIFNGHESAIPGASGPMSRNPSKSSNMFKPIPGSKNETTPAPDGRQQQSSSTGGPDDPTEPFNNGYHFPPKRPFVGSFKHGTRAFLKYCTTPLGFFVVVYGLNVVAWGGMLFLLLCNAAPAMCRPTCNDINSPRRKWIEYDSQILNAFFCITGFGLAPWRFRDLYFLLKYRVRGDNMGLRRLAGINRSWLRLPGSDKLPLQLGRDTMTAAPGSYSEDAVPYPVSSISDPPRTGVRAAPTKLWKLDFVIWMNVWNTLLQGVLAGLMWGYDRYTRPSWAVGLVIGLAFAAAGLAGLMIFLEGRRVKSIEGVPVTQDDLERLQRDKELGIPHYNNLKDKKPKEKDGLEQDIEKSRSGSMTG